MNFEFVNRNDCDSSDDAAKTVQWSAGINGDGDFCIYARLQESDDWSMVAYVCSYTGKMKRRLLSWLLCDVLSCYRERDRIDVD